MSRRCSLLQILLLLTCRLSSVSCSTASTPEAVAGILCFACLGIITIIMCCKHYCRRSSAETAQQIPTIVIAEIPDRVTCPYCSGDSSNCPLATSPAYFYSHPQTAYEPPPSYSSLVIHECPTIQKTFQVQDNAPSADHPK